jgi:hypothetical protein
VTPAPAPRLLALVAAAALTVLAGCSGGSDASASPTPTPTRAVSSASASASAAASGALSEAPELEALLPDTIAGEQTQKLSMKGATLMAGGAVDSSFTDFLDRLGAQPSDVSVAFATAVQADSQAFAYRVAGTAPADLLREFQASVGASQGGSDMTWKSVTVGARQVQQGASSSTDKAIYLIPHGDTIFVVVTGDPAIAAEIVASLP